MSGDTEIFRRARRTFKLSAPDGAAAFSLGRKPEEWE